jgi:hypothetical protein
LYCGVGTEKTKLQPDIALLLAGLRGEVGAVERAILRPCKGKRLLVCFGLFQRCEAFA